MRGAANKNSIVADLLLSVLISAGVIFIGYCATGPGGVQSASAQTELIVFLQQPAAGSQLNGQVNFDVYFSGSNSGIIQKVGLEVVGQSPDADSQGFMYIVDSSADPEWLWHVLADTMDFVNGNYRIFIHAYDYRGSELNLVSSSGGEPIFPFTEHAPFVFSNDYVILHPQNNAEVSGTVQLQGNTSGEASGVVFQISNSSMPSQNYSVSATPSSGQQPVYWTAEFDTSMLPAAQYELRMDVVTLSGIQLSGRARSSFTVADSEYGTCPLPWQCTDWDQCTNGAQTRTCTDPNEPDCLSTTTMPATQQTCCVPLWECSGWGSCVYSVQTCVEYTDTNHCGIQRDAALPPLTAACSNDVPALPACELDWVCRDSVTCSDGSAICRSYEDPNDPDCLSTASMPATQNACASSDTELPAASCALDWECTEWIECDAGTRICAAYADPNDPDCLSISSRPATQSACDAPAFVEPKIVMVAPEDQQQYTTRYIPLEARVEEGSVDRLGFHFERENNVQRFIGEAEPFPTNPLSWALNWDTIDVPNGWYKVYARGYATIDGERRYFRSEESVTIAIMHPEDDQGAAVPAALPEAQLEPRADACNDADGDGVCDTIEVQLGYDPNIPDLTPEQAEELLGTLESITPDEEGNYRKQIASIKFEQPTTHGIAAPEKLKVSTVDNFTPIIGRNQLVFRGTGPPNAMVTLYIYSTPLVVETRTDEFGNFTYTLTQNMPDGEHEVYVTITDDTGKVVEKSNALKFFVRRAQAVTEEDYLRGDVNVETESESLISSYLIVALAIVGAVLIFLLGFYIIGKRRHTVA
ncbi:MAG: Ig-like domain-containing protein [Patescibacteria group bacterium]